MHLSDIFVLIFGIIGLTSLIGDMPEPTPELWGNLIIIFRVCLALVFLDILPRVLKKLGSSDLKDALMCIVPCVGVILVINAVNPNSDPAIMESVAFVVVFVFMMIVKLWRRHFIKKYGYVVASSDNCEKT